MAGAEDGLNPFLLYLLLVKATLTSFSGLASLPILREDLVERRHVLTDEQLNTAIVITRTTPGPVGLYVVSVGYFVAGFPGAIAGWAAMTTPALLILPLLHYGGRRAEHPRAKAVIQAVVLASAGLLWSATIPLARDAVTNWLTLAIVLMGLALLATRKVEALWVILGSSLIYLTAASLRLVSGLS